MIGVDFMGVLSKYAKEKNIRFLFIYNVVNDNLSFFGFNEENESKYVKAGKVLEPTRKTEDIPKELIAIFKDVSDFHGHFCTNRNVKDLKVKFDNRNFGKWFD